MEQIEQVRSELISYVFLKSKNVHVENKLVFITFFARLTRETSFTKKGKLCTHIQTVWVDIDERILAHTPEKAMALPNRVQQYNLTEDVFESLCQVSKSCPSELFYVIPLYQKSMYKVFKCPVPLYSSTKEFRLQ